MPVPDRKDVIERMELIKGIMDKSDLYSRFYKKLELEYLGLCRLLIVAK